ncbi:MAG: hypothetical protein AB7I32_10845 [Gammaproteobacteria bacterium]
MRRVPFLVLLSGLLCAASSSVPAREPFDFDAPPFLAGPSVSRSAFGVTYVYTGRAPFAASELQLTVVEVPKELGNDAARLPAHCLGAFLDALRTREPGLMLGSDLRESTLGALSLVERRWLSQRGARTMTGVTACALHRGHFVSANFADDLRTAVQSLPALRAALGRLVLHF